eukprot:TRINITY_DN104925_c0_g1_i1.p1 TRINITY_DN104925_c0_g1~~TRINITY_DN104925_c0_g1_i1.p1  ORF type:complete len:366 (+),score=52.48 TRINITY_DN104925_c0_g1_i1:107-1204(+)
MAQPSASGAQAPGQQVMQPSAQAATPGSAAVAAARPLLAGVQSAAADEWACPRCTFLNGPDRSQCEMCMARGPTASDRSDTDLLTPTSSGQLRAGRFQAGMPQRGTEAALSDRRNALLGPVPHDAREVAGVRRLRRSPACPRCLGGPICCCRDGGCVVPGWCRSAAFAAIVGLIGGGLFGSAVLLLLPSDMKELASEVALASICFGILLWLLVRSRQRNGLNQTPDAEAEIRNRRLVAAEEAGEPRGTTSAYEAPGTLRRPGSRVGTGPAERPQPAGRPRPARQSSIANLPTHELTLENVIAAAPEHKSCIICLTDFSPGDCQRMLPCFHRFHVQCIDTWLRQNGTCPTCLTSIDNVGGGAFLQS